MSKPELQIPDPPDGPTTPAEAERMAWMYLERLTGLVGEADRFGRSLGSVVDSAEKIVARAQMWRRRADGGEP